MTLMVVVVGAVSAWDMALVWEWYQRQRRVYNQQTSEPFDLDVCYHRQRRVYNQRTLEPFDVDYQPHGRFALDVCYHRQRRFDID